LKKAGLIYAAVTLLYLPFALGAGYYAADDLAASVARNLVLDGTFYHLWYLPAAMIGVMIVFLLSRKLPPRAVLCVTGALYLFGLFGDSYFGAVPENSFLAAVYEGGFHVFSYTRNGLFFAPLFLAMGAVCGAACAGDVVRPETSPRKSNAWTQNVVGLAVSAALMLVEGTLLHRFGVQRHDSMYIMLIPTMFFLFRLLLRRRGGASPFLREASLWVYLLHPAFIIAVRGAAKVLGLVPLLVENSLMHYIAVSLLTLAFSALVAAFRIKIRRKTA
jgi:serine/alanine racemase